MRAMLVSAIIVAACFNQARVGWSMVKPFRDRVSSVEATALDAAIEIARRDHAQARVVKLLVAGRIYWMKQVPPSEEDLAKALQSERDNLIAFREKGFPAPKVLHFETGRLVLADCGPDLRDVMIVRPEGCPEVIDAFHAAGQALGQLHSAGIALGRGRPKDMCWDGQAVCFIDLEQNPLEFDPVRTGAFNLRNFVLASVKYAYDHKADGFAATQAFLRGYAALETGATRESLASARSWARRRWWLACASIVYALLLDGNRNYRRAYGPAIQMLADRR